MKLPNGDEAVVDRRKITDYCLNPEHDEGKHKARLFQELLGLTLDNSQVLLDALMEAARTGDAVIGKHDKYGQRYVIDFDFAGPDGRVIVRSAWIIRTGEQAPRLVTCYIP
jgi:hypothetical protein